MAQGGKTGFDDFYDYQRSKQLIEALEKDILQLDNVFASFASNMGKFSKKFTQNLNETTAAMQANNAAIKALDKTQIDAVDSILKYTKAQEGLNKEGKETKATIKSIDQTVKAFSNTVDGQKALVSKLTTEFNKLDPAIKKDERALQRISQELIRAKTFINEMSAATRNTNNVLNRAEGSYNALTAAIKRDLDALKQIPGATDKSSAAYKRNATEIQNLQGRIRQNTEALKAFDAQIGRNFRNVGNYSSALGNLSQTAQQFAGAFGFVGGAFLVAQGIRSAIQNNIAYSDSLVGVQRTTDLADASVLKLANDLKKLDTRTSTAELLQIATAAGRLQVAEKDLLNFTDSVDLVTQALGDELQGTTEEIATSLGRIVTLFGDEKEIGLEKSLLRFGSVLNELGKNSKSNAGFINDFTLRLAGIGPQAGIASEEMAALGAVFGEVAPQRVEAASTALGRFLTQIGSDVPKFARLAGMEVEDFSRLLEDNAVEALLRVFEVSGRTTGGLEQISIALGDLGIEQERAKQVLGAFANSTDRARELIALAKRETDNFKGTTIENSSVLKEAELRNNNLAGSYEKLVNSLVDVSTNSSTAARGLQFVIDAARQSIEFIGNDGLTGVIRDYIDELENLEKKQKEAAKEAKNVALAETLYNQALKEGIKDFESFKFVYDATIGATYADQYSQLQLLTLIQNKYNDGLKDGTDGTEDLSQATINLNAALKSLGLTAEDIKDKNLLDLFNIKLPNTDQALSDLTKLVEDAANLRDAAKAISGADVTSESESQSLLESIIFGGKDQEAIDKEFEESLKESAKLGDDFRKEQDEKEIEALRRKEEIKREIIRGTFEVINAFADTYFQNQQTRLDNELNALQEKYDNDIELAGENENAKRIIEKRFDEERKALQREQAEARKRATLFNIALQTIEGVVTAIAQPPGPPATLVFGAIMAAVGAARLAAAKAVEIPQFADGTDNAPGGTVMVNDKPRSGGVNREVITTPQGKSFFFDTDRPVITDSIPKGSKIDPRDISDLAKDYSPIASQHQKVLDSFGEKVNQNRYVTVNNEINYEKLGEVIASKMPAVHQLIFEKGGRIKKAVIKGNTTRIVEKIDLKKLIG